MRALDLVDDALHQRALVFGSLPPAGRDLDVLVSPDDLVRVSEALRSASYLKYGSCWVAPAAPDATAEVVDLASSDAWSLPAEALRELMGHASVLPGRRRLAQPAPHHTLLILAGRVARAGCLGVRGRQRLDAAVAQDPLAWERARTEAFSWSRVRAVDQLQRLASTGVSAGRRERIAAVAEPFRAAGAPASLAAARAALVIYRRAPRPPSIRICGPDQAAVDQLTAALEQTLGAAGVRAKVLSGPPPGDASRPWRPQPLLSIAIDGSGGGHRARWGRRVLVLDGRLQAAETSRRATQAVFAVLADRLRARWRTAATAALRAVYAATVTAARGR